MDTQRTAKRTYGLAGGWRAALLFVAMAVLSCKDDPAGPGSGAAVVDVSPDSTTLNVSAAQQLAVTVRDADGTPLGNGSVSWSTSDADIATVTNAGLVTARGAGRAVITASTGGKTGNAVIIVRTEPRDVVVEDVQWTQATQAPDGSIPMVLNGNAVAVNVVMSSTPPMSGPTQVVLRLTNAAGDLVRADTAVANSISATAPPFLTPTVQFRLPATAIQPGLRWQVIRDPRRLLPDDAQGNDAFPAGAPALLSTTGVPVLRLRFVPVVLTAHGNVTGDVNTGNLDEYLRTARSVFPLGAVEASVGEPFSTSQSFGTPPSGGDATAFWTPVLQAMDAARIASPEPFVHWIGVVRPPPGFTTTQNGGIGFVPASGTNASGRTALVTSLNWADRESFTREITAHELGHNFGRRHAPCGGAPNTDPSFPYPGASIGQPGFDVRAWMEGRAAAPVPVPPGTRDVMSYCDPAWISDYNYRGVLNFRGSIASGRPATAAARARTRVVLVRGTIVDREGVRLAPAFAIDAPPALPASTGPYRLEARDIAGRVIFALNFTPEVIDHAPALRHFAFAVPLTPADEAAVATIDVRGPEGRALRTRKVGPPALRAPGDLAPRRLAGGLVRVTCEDSAAAGILVRGAVSGAVLATANAPNVDIATRSGASLEVVCSDGVVSSRTSVIVP
jgi:hypothetical protein